MPGGLRSRPFLWTLLVLAFLGAAGYTAMLLRNRPPSTHPLFPISSETVSLSAPVPSLDDLRASAEGASIVICVIDAARVDHIGCYGYPRDTTLNLDRLAEQSLVFEQHFCQYPQTKPSTASLFTSQYPDTHLTFAMRTMHDSTFTMAEGLKAAGFHSAFFSSNKWAAPQMGIGGDFDWIRAPASGRSPRAARPPRPGRGRGPSGRPAGEATRPVSARSPESLLEAFSEWLEQRPPRRFFAYIHLLPPHTPYDAPESMKQLFAGKPAPNFWRGRLPFREVSEVGGAAEHAHSRAELVNLYDANLIWADWAVGRVENLLRQDGVLDDTLFIVTSDHGETFGEHGYKWHPACPYDEVIRIPLLMRFPGEQRPAGRVRALTQTVDLLPTILDLFGAAYPRDEVQGQSLLHLLTGDVEKVSDYVFCRTQGRPPAYVVHGLRFTLILYQGGKLRALYDLEADPWQTRNIIAREPERAAELARAFREFAKAQRHPPLDFIDPDAETAALPEVPEIELSDETRRELKALGYLE